MPFDEPRPLNDPSLWVILVSISIVLLTVIIGMAILIKQIGGTNDRINQIEKRVDRMEQHGLGSTREFYRTERN